VAFFEQLADGLFILQPRLCLATKTLSICSGTSTDKTPEFAGSNNRQTVTDNTRHRPTFSNARAFSKEKGWRVRFLLKALSTVVCLDILGEFFMTILEIIHEKLYQQYEGLLAFTSYLGTSQIEGFRGKGLAKATLSLGIFFPLNLLHLISSPGGT
jgi:hypothetical protein